MAMGFSRHPLRRADVALSAWKGWEPGGRGVGASVTRAVRGDLPELLDALLDAGCDVNSRRFTLGVHETLLHSAAISGNAATVRVLLAHGAEIEAVDDAGCTPLLSASSNGHTQVALQLLGAGANPCAAAIGGLSPLYCAVRYEDHPLVTALLAKGAQPTSETAEVEQRIREMRLPPTQQPDCGR